MVTRTTDLDVLQDKIIYIYGTQDVARRIFFILWERYLQCVEGFVSGRNEKNKPAGVFGIPVIDIDDVPKAENVYIVEATDDWQPRESVDEMLAHGYTRVLMLHYKFKDILRLAVPEETIRYFDDTDYLIYAADEVEKGHAVLADRQQQWDFKARISVDKYWFEVFKENLGKRMLQKKGLQKTFEDMWGSFSLVRHIKETEESKNIVSDLCDCYSIRCHVDKSLSNSEGEAYLEEIQAGAALTEKRICKLLDNTGDNISERNRDFSECSAIYWIWKNASKKDYVGVCHYRRHLAVTTGDLAEAFADGVDVINTIPTVMLPSIYEFFRKNFFYGKDVQLIEEAIDDLFPEYRASYDELGNGFIYLANNIFIMKSEWFDKMCEFVFGVILYVDDYYRTNGFVRQDRYAGYIFEYLYAVFVLHHAKEMKITYADMKFLE